MKLFFKIVKGILLLIVILGLVYFFGPKVAVPDMDKTLPEVTSDVMELEELITEREASIANLKPDNDAQIVWFDSIPQKTEYSIVYLHGWSASRMEGHPLHVETAKRYGCNLYLPRLAGHGLVEKEAMLDLTADALVASAKEAIAIAKQLGDKVIIMATSTGGTLALHLAGGDADIVGLLLYSPNVEIYDPNAKLLAGPWGLQLAKMVKQGNYHEPESTEEEKKYWTPKYRVEALTHLQALVDNMMKQETFKEVTQPVFLGYFYKNDSIQDKVVSVPAMLSMYQQLGTPEDVKRKVAFPDVGAHVMTSYITSKDLDAVKRESYSFFEQVLDIQPKKTATKL